MSSSLPNSLRSEPVPNTCKHIDKLKDDISDNVTDILSAAKNINNLLDDLENLRDANSALREWGNSLIDYIDEIETKYEQEILMLNDRINENSI